MKKPLMRLLNIIRLLPKKTIDMIEFTEFILRYQIFKRKNKNIINKRSSLKNEGILLVGGAGQNEMWVQIWTLLCAGGGITGLKAYFITHKRNYAINKYFYFIRNIKLIYIEDLYRGRQLEMPECLKLSINTATTLEDYREIYYEEMPIGEIAVSTYSRNHGTGVIDFESKSVIAYINESIKKVWIVYYSAKSLINDKNIKVSFNTEIFLDEYGAIYYASLQADVDVLQFAGTVRDNAIIVQRKSKADSRLHHAGLSKKTWDILKTCQMKPKQVRELELNFKERYSNKWHRATRNFPVKRYNVVNNIRDSAQAASDRQVVVVFSHILYDTLFFFGKDIFPSYATWLLETVREAVKNSELDWYIKIHPSNIWRGEIGFKFKGMYEEERLILENFGQLPSHVKLIYPNSEFSPLEWMTYADFGVTVRGTSGLEMAALGKTVITAGTGRYENLGFTHDPRDAHAYRETLRSLPNIRLIDGYQVTLAKQYAHALFVLKPRVLNIANPRKRKRVKRVMASDDLIYMPTTKVLDCLQNDIAVISDFINNKEIIDLLS